MSEALSVLVVDDSRDAAESLADIIELEGHVATFCYSGEEALAILDTTPYPLVFMDIRMPGMGGVAAAMEILKRWPQVVVVFVTGNAHSQDDVLAPTRGRCQLLRKPYGPDQIREILDRAGESRWADGA